MATNVRIQCINKADRYNPHRNITHVGGINPDGTRWKIPEEDAIQYIKNGTYSFYVSVNGRTVDVIIATHQGREYLKTTSDGITSNNLLSLAECPVY